MDEARDALIKARDLTQNNTERLFILEQIKALQGS
jgi:predicted RNA polymerase sigma factor